MTKTFSLHCFLGVLSKNAVQDEYYITTSLFKKKILKLILHQVTVKLSVSTLLHSDWKTERQENVEREKNISRRKMKWKFTLDFHFD